MEQNFISQTPLDRMVSSDCGQMLKAAIPYLPASGRQILSVYEKAMELKNYDPDAAAYESAGRQKGGCV